MSTLQTPADASTLDAAAVVAPPRTPSSELAHGAVRAEQRAWLVLWLAFLTFCILGVSAVAFAVNYFNTADFDLTARVEDSRGIVFVQPDGGRQVRLTDPTLNVGAVIETAASSSATVRLFDNSHVIVHPGARVELARMDVGRFVNRQTLVLRQHEGPVQYHSATELTVLVPGGVVHVPPGDVTVWVQGGRTRVLAYEGEARFEGGATSVVVPAGHRAELTPDRRLTAAVPIPEQVLRNADFSRRTEGWQPVDQVAGRDVTGERRFDSPGPTVEGNVLPSLRLIRSSQTGVHGETGLRQALDVDISGFRSLVVEAWVRVDYASLSGGGQLGSEYPMMLRLEYEGTAEGSQYEWVVGFYYDNPEDRPVPNAAQIERSGWLRYVSKDLMSQEEARRPTRLRSFEVMAQGHSFDARVADVRVIAK